MKVRLLHKIRKHLAKLPIDEVTEIARGHEMLGKDEMPVLDAARVKSWIDSLADEDLMEISDQEGFGI